MDKTISARFYDVQKANVNVPGLKSVLQRILRKRPAANREALLAANYLVRLERLDTHSGGDISGEFTRAQTTNYPSEVHDDAVRALHVDVPLGHGIAFFFRAKDSLMALQFEPRVLTSNRIASYIQAMDTRAMYIFSSHLRVDSWSRLQQYPLRKLLVGIANPHRLTDIENSRASVASSFLQMSEAYGAPQVNLELSMGRHGGSLAEPAKELARQFFALFRTNRLELRKLRGVVKEPGTAADELNLLDEVMSVKGTLDLSAK